MALTATATQGFEKLRYVERDEVLWVPGDPGDTFTRGDLVTFTAGEGLADPAAAGEDVYGVVAQTVACSAATVGFPNFGADSPSATWGDLSSDARDTLIPIYPMCAAGTPVLLATFANQTDDENITAYTAATPSITVAAVANDNDHEGGLVYVYGGPGLGQFNIISDSTASTNILTLHRIFETAVTTASDVIYLPGAAGTANAPGFFGRVDLADQNNLTVSTAASGLDWVVYLDARDTSRYLGSLKLPIIQAAAMSLA